MYSKIKRRIAANSYTEYLANAAQVNVENRNPKYATER